jgi:uncharacterized protein YqeY
MALLEKISDDMKSAMKSGKKLRLETLRMIRAGLLEKQVEKRPSGGMTGEDEVAVLIAAAKKRKEAVSIYREKGREDLARTEEEELGIIQEYLPRQLTAAEIEELVKKAVNASGAATAKDFGKVMPIVMKELKGKADGKLVQEIVKRTLGM